MNCCAARSTLPLLLDGQIAAGERAAAIDRAMACQLCRAELAAMAQNDAALKRALAAQAAVVPAGYFEDFWPRLAARLDAETTQASALEGSEGEKMSTSSGAGNDVAGKPLSKDEFSGLHEIKALAASTVARRSKERRAESDPGEDVGALLVTAAPSALGSVLLPQPGKEVAPPKVRATSVSDADGVRAAPLAAPPRASRVGLYVGALGLAAAAAAIGLYLKNGASHVQSAAAPAALSEHAAPPAGAIPAAGAPAAIAPEEAKPEVAPLVDPAAGKRVAEAEEGPPADKPGDARGAAKPDDKERTAAKEPGKPEGKAAAKDAGKDKAGAVAKDAKGAKGAPAEPAKPAAPKNEIDDLFGDKPAETQKPVAAGPALPEKLEQADVKKGMSTVKARVQACYDEFKVPGTIKLKVKIEADGNVSTADVVDQKFAGTETGACVSAAVKNAKFPAVSGTSLVVSYPFILQ